MARSLSARPDAEAFVVAAVHRPPRARSAASLRRQPSAPPRSAAVSSPARSSTSASQLAACLLARRQPLRQRPLALHQVVRERAPRPVLLHEVRAREHDAVVQRHDRLVDVLLRRGRSRRAAAGPVSGPASRTVSATSRAVALRLGAVRRDERGARAAARCRPTDPRQVLAHAGEPCCGQLVLRAPEKAHLLAPAHERPVRPRGPPSCARGCRSPAPRATAGRRPPSAGAARGPTSSTKAAASSSVRTMRSSLQECPRSGRFARCATTRPWPGRSTSSSRRPTT